MVLSGLILDDDNLAEDRIKRLPTEERMVFVEGTLRSSADSAPAEADGKLKSDKSDAESYMRHSMRERLPFWREIGACDMVLG